MGVLSSCMDVCPTLYLRNNQFLKGAVGAAELKFSMEISTRSDIPCLFYGWDLVEIFIGNYPSASFWQRVAPTAPLYIWDKCVWWIWMSTRSSSMDRCQIFLHGHVPDYPVSMGGRSSCRDGCQNSCRNVCQINWWVSNYVNYTVWVGGQIFLHGLFLHGYISVNGEYRWVSDLHAFLYAEYKVLVKHLLTHWPVFLSLPMKLYLTVNVKNNQ